MDPEQPSLIRIIEEEIIDYLIRSHFFHPKYVSTLGLKGNERILEFGCGGGAMSIAIAHSIQLGGHLTCIDISEYWIKKAQQRLKNYGMIEFRTGDITKMDIPENYYDAVIIHFVLHDVDPSMRIDIMNALAKSLRPEGTLYIREPSKPSHGIPLLEIQNLMRDVGLREHQVDCARSILWKSICDGVFLKSW